MASNIFHYNPTATKHGPGVYTYTQPKQWYILNINNKLKNSKTFEEPT